MQAYLILAALILILKYEEVLSDDDSEEKFEEKSVTNEIFNLLNRTYFSLNEKVCQLQRKVDAIERIADPDNQCKCNETEIIEFKRSISVELKSFSKTLSGFENHLRLLKNEQAEVRELLDGRDSDASTTTTTTAAPRVCDQGWISSPEKCYYVATVSKITDWATGITRCTAMGAKLVEIQTDEEGAFLVQSMPSRVRRRDIIYTGRKRNDADDWVFVSNDKMIDTSVRSWGSGNPDGRTQKCGCIMKNKDFLMLDCFCTGYELFYIDCALIICFREEGDEIYRLDIMLIIYLL